MVLSYCMGPGNCNYFTRLLFFFPAIADKGGKTLRIKVVFVHFRRIKAWIGEKKLKKIPRIDAYSPVPGNFGVSRE